MMRALPFCAAVIDAFKFPRPRHGDTWDAGDTMPVLVLTFTKDGRYRYEIDLEECATSAQTLDRIFQVATKAWADAKDLGDLIYALEDLLNPQGILCSFGMNKTLNVKERLAAKNIGSPGQTDSLGTVP